MLGPNAFESFPDLSIPLSILLRARKKNNSRFCNLVLNPIIQFNSPIFVKSFDRFCERFSRNILNILNILLQSEEDTEKIRGRKIRKKNKSGRESFRVIVDAWIMEGIVEGRCRPRGWIRLVVGAGPPAQWKLSRWVSIVWNSLRDPRNFCQAAFDLVFLGLRFDGAVLLQRYALSRYESVIKDKVRRRIWVAKYSIRRGWVLSIRPLGIKSSLLAKKLFRDL